MDLNALRDYIKTLMRPTERGAHISANALYAQMNTEAVHADHDQGHTTVPKQAVSRATFYKWFREEKPVDPTPMILECIPAIAKVFGEATSESKLYSVAGILPQDMDTAVMLQFAVRQMRAHVREATRALRAVELPGTAEALVVDRILQSRLDYQIRVWPVVRGRAYPMHLRSWLGLTPLEADQSRQRLETRKIEAMSVEERREHIRSEVITEGLWQSLGLRWREERPLEWPKGDQSELRIELPVDEKNQTPGSSPWLFDSEQFSRILVISGLWGHAEPLASILAGALDWGTHDVRYQALSSGSPDARLDFMIRTLRKAERSFAWALAPDAVTYDSIADALVTSSKEHLIVVITYGPRVAEMAARAWRVGISEVRNSQSAACRAAFKANQMVPIVHVRYDDSDITTNNGVDVDLFIDHVRYTAAEILVLLQEVDGPDVRQWRKPERFLDLRHGPKDIVVPPRKSTVSWQAPQTFELDG